MALEFAIQYPCSLRARFAEKQLREWGRLGNLYARVRESEVTPSEETRVWVEKNRSEMEVMIVETDVCASCPACLFDETREIVGCIGRINYPIEAQFEKFLADRVQLALDTIDESDQPRLLRILVDPESPFDGEATKDLRRVTTADGLRFFELRVPIRLSRAAARLTSDNIFDLLAGFRSDDFERTTYTRELPFEATGDFYDFLDLILRNDLSQSEISRLNARGSNYSQFLRLLSAIERAEALNTRLLLD